MGDPPRLERDFFARDTVVVAKDLLGKMLVRKIGNSLLSGIITETEAYRHKDDAASHAHRKMTERNKAMFGRVGHAYVYFTYGMYHCFNVVARSERFDAGAVLIRAVRPIDGMDIMLRNRNVSDVKILANGPAKLTMAFDITKRQYGEDLVSSKSIFIARGAPNPPKIIASPRIGIRQAMDKKWNFRISV